MKTYTISIVFALLGMVVTASGQTVSEVRAELIRQGIPHPDIVLAQARLETGNFTSKLCRTRHNIFGIKHGRNYASYRSWRECVSDYKKRISSRYKGGDYYTFLEQLPYAQDKEYTNKLRKIARRYIQYD